MKNIDNLIACSHCDLVLKTNDLLLKQHILKCPRCESEIGRYSSEPKDIFAFSLGALIFLIATFFAPILKFEIRGISDDFSLWETPLKMFENEQYIIGIVILILTILAPLLYFLSILLIVSPLYLFNKRAKKIKLLFKIIKLSQEWIMLEVFLISFFVAMIKLSENMSLNIDFAMIPLIALIILTAFIQKRFNIKLYYSWIRNG